MHKHQAISRRIMLVLGFTWEKSCVVQLQPCKGIIIRGPVLLVLMQSNYFKLLLDIFCPFSFYKYITIFPPQALTPNVSVLTVYFFFLGLNNQSGVFKADFIPPLLCWNSKHELKYGSTCFRIILILWCTCEGSPFFQEDLNRNMALKNIFLAT